MARPQAAQIKIEEMDIRVVSSLHRGIFDRDLSLMKKSAEHNLKFSFSGKFCLKKTYLLVFGHSGLKQIHKQKFLKIVLFY